MGSTGSADPDNASLGPPDAVRAVRSANPLDRFTSQGLLRPNIALRYGLYDARVHDHPTVARYSRLWTELIPTSSSFRTEFDDRGPSSLSSCWISSRCGAFSSRVPGSREQVYVEKAGCVGKIRLSRHDLALPRAFLATAWASSSGVNDALAEVASTDRAQLRRRPIIEGAPTTRGASADPLPQQVTRYDDHEVEIAVDAPRAGYLVLTDTFFPGWKAEVDGHASAILPANAAFRAVAVPPGRHTVTFGYRPASVVVGVGITLASLLGLAFASIAPPTPSATAYRIAPAA